LQRPGGCKSKPMSARRILPRGVPHDRYGIAMEVEQVRRVYRTRFMGGLNEPNVPDALRAVCRKPRASIALTRQRTPAQLFCRHELQSGLQ
jgi:hypothetical protein